MLQKDSLAQNNPHHWGKVCNLRQKIYIYNVKEQSRENGFIRILFCFFFSIKENHFQAGKSRTNIIRRELKHKIGAEIIRECFTALN